MMPLSLAFKRQALIYLSCFTALCMLIFIRKSNDIENNEHFRSEHDPLNSLKATIQNAIWEEISQNQKPLQQITELQQQLACRRHGISTTYCAYHPTPMAPVSDALELCGILASKRLLLLGSSQTFNLHNHILSYASQTTPDVPPHTCLGPEFCTFHHICLQPSNDSALKAERKIRPPSPRNLLATHSALMHYIQSYSLAPHSRPDHSVYVEPLIDRNTGIRVKETYWLGPARRADIIVLGRSPIPAPAWTHDGTETGNWSFTDFFLEAENHGQKFRTPDQRLRAVIRAALHITREKYLPEVSRTLETLHSDTSIRTKVIIWHGSLLHHSNSCQFGDYVADIFKEHRLRQDDNLWAVYHDAQKYIQEHILMIILRQKKIVFLPLDFNTVSQDLGIFGGDVPSCVAGDAGQIEKNFIGNLAFILQKMGTWGAP